jgi:O-antigen ligase
MINYFLKTILILPFILPSSYQASFPVNNIGSLNLLDLFLIIGIIGSLFLIYKKNYSIEFKKYLVSKKIIILFVLFITIATLVNLSNDWISNLSTLKSFFILPIFWSITTSFLIKKSFLSFWYFLYSYLIYTVVLGVFVFVFKFLQKTTFDNRISLFFESPNQLAISLSLGIITILILGSRFNKNIFYFLLILLPALWWTQSLGALIAILGVISIHLNKFLKNKSFFVSRFFVLFSCFWLALILLTPFLYKEFKYNPFLNQNSLDSRMVIYEVSQKIISNNFWDGIGPKNFQTEYLFLQSKFPSYPQWAVPHAHNLFLQIWSAYGIFSLFLFILFLNKKSLSLKKDPSNFIFYFLIYFLIHGLIDTPIWNNDQSLFFWFIFLA